MRKFKIIRTAERVSSEELSDNFVYQRSLLVYYETAKIVHGTVLEIGTGAGYGIQIISSNSEKFITIDKKKCIDESQLPTNTLFIKMKAPRLFGIADNSIDCVISFQVIEHIKNDQSFIHEIHRVLKKGGKLILSTPHKNMSLTRNPWHVREYSINELDNLFKSRFTSINKLGIFGNQKVHAYYHLNKLAVAKFKRYDLLKFHERLPGKILQIPYDLLNRVNRKRLLKNHQTLTKNILMEDYSVQEASEDCFDLFFIAEKH